MIELRIAASALVGGVLSALAFTPWLARILAAAESGEPAGAALGGLGLVLAVPVWAGCGAWVGRTAPGALAGALAAGVAGLAAGLPAVELWAMEALWGAAATGVTGEEAVREVLGASVLGLLWWSVVAWWGALALGAAAGAVGGRLAATERADLAPPLVWPLLVASGAVMLGAVGLAATASLARSTPAVWPAGLVNAGLWGAVAAAPLVAAGTGHARAAGRAQRLLSLAYLVAGALLFATWVVIPSIVAAEAIFSPWIVACLGLPALGIALGALLGRRAAPARRPEWRDLLAECALFVPVALLLFYGPGGLSTGLAMTLPVQWIVPLSGAEPFPDPGPPIRLFLALHLSWAQRIACLAPLVPVVPGALAIAVIRLLTR